MSAAPRDTASDREHTILQAAVAYSVISEVSTMIGGQSVENQLQPLQAAAGRLGWTVVASALSGRALFGIFGRVKRIRAIDESATG